MAELMTEKEIYKKIKLAIVISVDRFYQDLDFNGSEELKKKTIKSIYNEYKRNYPLSIKDE